jgi:bacteriorhodopsin
MFEYLATQTTRLGSLGWLFVVIQVAALLAGLYLLFLQTDPHPVRGPLLKRLGYLLGGLGALGLLLAIGRVINLGPLTYRWWFYALAIVEILAAAYVLYYQRNVYPAQMAAYRASARRGQGRPVVRGSNAAPRANGVAAAPPPPRPESITSRRESRRERKRRK